ncbi:MAG: hypothetical protein Q4G11_07525 [Gallicola sp.]|nr:hypothetical protein [Gallicola sp.]
MVIYTKDTENLEMELDNINGALVLKDVIKDLKVENINGALSVETSQSFPMDIESVNGALNMEFANKNLVLEIENLNSAASIFGNNSLSFGTGEEINITEGEGRDKIRIGSVNGVVNIK